MSLNKIIGLALLATSGATFADTAPIDFTVEANIPSSNFYVVAENGWNVQKQTFFYDPITQKLDTMSRTLLAKHTAGGINAYLVKAAAMDHTLLTSSIPLTVSVNGEELKLGPANPAIIIPVAGASATEHRLPLVLTPPAAGHAAYSMPGQYEGTISLMFDATT